MAAPGAVSPTVGSQDDYYIVEAMFRQTFGQAPMGMAIMSLDGRISNANPALCAMLGYTEAELTARSFRDITYLKDLPDSEELFVRLLSGVAESLSLDKRYVGKGGGIVMARLVATLVRDQAGNPLCFIAMMDDLTASQKAQAEARIADKRTQAILNNIDDFVFVSGLNGKLTYVSPECTKLLGWFPEELVGGDLYKYIYPEDRAAVKGTIEEFLSTSDKRICLRCRAAHKEGQWIWVDTYVWAVPGAAGPRQEIAGMMRDISEYEREHTVFVEEIEQAHARRAAEEDLALTDQLTGLRNRKAADDMMIAKLNSVRASAFPVGCLLVDVDHFQQVKEKHGGEAGEQIVKQIGALVAESCRDDDFLARYSDDQFLIVLPGTNPAGTIICGEKVLRKIRVADWSQSPTDDRISVSIGATCVQFRSGLTLPELMSILTSQLEQAKEAGGNRMVMNTRQLTAKMKY